MGILEIVLIGFGVAMDAFAVSVSKGLSAQNKKLKTAIACASWFAVFQMLMPLAGFYLGEAVDSFIDKFDHWIVFAILAFLGSKMIADAIFGECEKHKNDIGFKTMLMLSFATSIDALAVGLSFSLSNVNLWTALAIIGGITFVFCFVGTLIASKFNSKHNKITTFLGGLILIAIAIKILLEHLFF